MNSIHLAYQNVHLAGFQPDKRSEFVKVCTIKRWHTSMRDAACVSSEFPAIQGFTMVIEVMPFLNPVSGHGVTSKDDIRIVATC
jgi:hypothetical protein